MAERKTIRLSVISIWVGILIPIVAALIPYALEYFSPQNRLEYEVVGPISAKGTQALLIKVTNNGGKVEKNVRIWLNTYPQNELPEILRPKGEKKKDPVDLIAVESKTNIAVSKEGQHFVLLLGDLRPNEEVAISIVAREVTLALYASTRSVSGIDIKSDEHVAGFKGRTIWEELFYPFGFWMFIILMVLLLLVALYQEYFMDPKTREKMILKEIDKLKK